MKKIILFSMICLLSISCVTNKNFDKEISYQKTIDSLKLIINNDNEKIYYLNDSVISLNRTVQIKNDSIIKLNKINNFLSDSIKNHVCVNVTTFDEFNKSFAIEKIKYYVKICDKNPKNKVFLFGWIKRTLRKL